MIDIEKEKQDLNRHIEEYKEKYKQYLLEILEKHNIKERTTIMYSNRYNSIGVLKVVEINDNYSCITSNPYEINFYLITNKGEISKNIKAYLYYWDIEKYVLDYAPTKLDINNKKNLIQIVKGLKNGEVTITDYLI